MFARKAGAYLGEATFRVGSMLKKLARDKRSSLLRKFVTYGCTEVIKHWPLGPVL